MAYADGKRRYTKALDAIKSLRKDKVAELKTENVKLESLSKEKATADALRNTISDLTADIAQNSIELDQKKEELRLQTDSNKKFYESSTKFREIYIKVDGLNSTKKHYQEELDALKENLHELAGIILPCMTAGIHGAHSSKLQEHPRS